jgi:hypothetical protein
MWHPSRECSGINTFSHFIYDMSNVVNSVITLFADDTLIVGTVKCQGYCEYMTQMVLAMKWQMKFHQKKCKVMKLGASWNTPLIEI